jgi:hypothetical protein
MYAAKSFYALFLELPQKTQNAFIKKLLNNIKYKEDLIDYVIAEVRKREKFKPFNKPLQNSK